MCIRDSVLLNQNAFPRVFLVDTCRVFEDVKAIYPEVLRGTDDLRWLVYLEEEPGIELAADSVSTDSAWIIHYENDSILVGLDCRRNHILVMTDNYYDAWHAFVDGEPARLLRAYGSFRAVPVVAGAKQVLFKYRSQRYVTGRLASWLTWIYVFAVVGYYAIRAGSARREKGVISARKAD